ncbi:MAG TPA: hypothetical protein VJ832_13610, partial [Variovorax sp.]|nr:hypothetical protein [Variovorax sp.]
LEVAVLAAAAEDRAAAAVAAGPDGKPRRSIWARTAHSAKRKTFEWQARSFQAMRGYEAFGRIDRHTKGFCPAFMMKALCPGGRIES